MGNRGHGKILCSYYFLRLSEHQSQHTTCFMINLTLKQVVVDTTAVPALYIVGQ